MEFVTSMLNLSFCKLFVALHLSGIILIRHLYEPDRRKAFSEAFWPHTADLDIGS